MAVSGGSILDAHQEEIGVGGIDALHARKRGQQVLHHLALLEDFGHLTLFLPDIAQHADSLALRHLVDVVRILDVVEVSDYLPGSHCDTEAHGSMTPRLGESLQDDEVGILVKQRHDRRHGREVDVSLVDHDNPVLAEREQLLYLLFRESVARGVVGRTEPKHLGVGVHPGFESLDVESESVRVQRHGTELHVVDFGADLIHAVSRHGSHDIVHPRTAENPVHEVDGLVRTVAQENLFLGHALDGGKLLLDLPLTRVRIAVETIVVGVFVGVDTHACLAAELVARAAVGSECLNVRPHQFAQIHILSFFLFKRLCSFLFEELSIRRKVFSL